MQTPPLDVDTMQNRPSVPPINPSTTLSIQKNQRFSFHGNASEYFGIWIVNILLMIITLTLYAPWAKVRRLRYFYRNTELLQRRFDFTGLPSKIFIGRMIALVVVVVVTYATNYSMKITGAGFLILYAFMPWLVRSSLRFRARNSKFGNSRMYFSGTNKQAYSVFIVCLAIYFLTLGLFYPVMIWLYKRYSFDYLQIGQLKFEFKATWGNFMSAVYFPIFLLVLMSFATVIAFFALGLSFSNLKSIGYLVGIFYVAVIAFIWPLIQARLFIATWNNVTVSRSYFTTDANQWRYAWIVLSNWIARILTIGLLTPWAAIRLYKYQLESLNLYLRNDPDLLVNELQNDPNAIAEEMADIFDFDVSL
jgi:uncharacterized membrane protein YjgN (DUF898 family)